MKIKLSKQSKEYQELINGTDKSLPMKLRRVMVRNLLKQNKDKSVSDLVSLQRLMDKSYKEQTPLSQLLKKEVL